MRKFEGKQYGYIILPIVIPAGMTAEQALDDNETFAVVWDVLKALRSHGERLEARINALPYDRNNADAVVKIIDGTEDDVRDNQEESEESEEQEQQMDFLEYAPKLQQAVNAQIVKKCGTKVYWDLWAKDIAGIAKRHIQRIGEIIHSNPEANREFTKFLRGLRDSLNESISEDQAVEMLAQHIITLPVFEALFGGADFAASNPVSIAMEKMLAVLREYTLETETEKRELRELYASVRMRAEGIRSDAGRQAVIKDLYESFFKEAFKATSEKMGIVYTPNQAEDFGAFCAAGRALAEFHIHYETVEPYPLQIVGDYENPGPVEKMRWGKKKNPETGKLEKDKSVLVYNKNLTFRGIPEVAHRYVVNGRSPLEWVIDRYQVKTDKASGIVNDPNLYSDDPHYITDLIRRLVTVSVETVKIIENMKKLDEKDCSIEFPDAWKVEKE